MYNEVACRVCVVSNFPRHGARGGGEGDDGDEKQEAVRRAQPRIEKSLSCDQSGLLGATAAKYALFRSR